jgi:hypothetical protein
MLRSSELTNLLLSTFALYLRAARTIPCGVVHVSLGCGARFTSGMPLLAEAKVVPGLRRTEQVYDATG